MADQPTRSPLLSFDPALPEKELEKVRDNVSAIVLEGDHLWLGGDEGTAIHRMTRTAAGDFGDHTIFELKDTLRLPGPAKEEIDVEGLDVDGGYLWLIGSHSAKRKKADKEKSAEKNIERLSEVGLDGNRFTLARVPLNDAAEPVAGHGGLTAARLRGDSRANLLIDALLKDPHVGGFVPRVGDNGTVKGVPSKDNGFDVEGLAVAGNRVFLGLRGPVLRGWAIVIELQVEEAADGSLMLEKPGASGGLYLKHFLQLDGLGVRDLSVDGDDLLVLGGPSMDLDGPVYIYRWKDALKVRADSLTWNADLPKVVTVPFAVTKDHAEGLTVVSRSPMSVMVCYDSPAATRIAQNGVKADVFAVNG